MVDKSLSEGSLLGSIFLILCCQLIGEILVRLLSMPVPGPVLGMLILFVFLCIRGHVPDMTERVGDTLLSNLSLLFVPAGVGVVQYAQQMQNEALAISVSIIAGTIAAIAFVAWLAQRILPKHGAHNHE